jgi:O-antigen/teichoic acid export membrane protein
MADPGAFGSALRWMAFGRLAAQLVSWAATIFVLRLLQPEDYGLAAICTAVVGAVAIVSDFALSAGLVQARDLHHDQMRGVLGAVLLIALACTTAVWLAAPALGAFFDSPQAVPMIRVAALQLMFGPWAAVPDAMLRRQLRFQALAGVEFVSIVAASGMTLALALGGANAWALVLGPIGGAAVRLSMLYLVAPTRVWPDLDFAPARALIRFGATMAMSRVAGYVFGQSDVWIAARAFPKTQLGEYSVAMHLAMLPMSKAMGVLNDVLFPLVAKMNRDGEDIRRPLLEGLRLGMYVAVPVLWGLALAAVDLLPLLIGAKWNSAVPIVQIICLLLPLRAVNVALATVLQGGGRADLDLRNTLTGALILPPLFVLGASHGPLGLAGAWAVGLPIVVTINLVRSRHALGVNPVLVARAALARPLALGAALGAMGVGVRFALFGPEPSWPALIVTAISSQGVYWALLATVDRHMLRRLLGLTGLQRTAVRLPEVRH